MMKVDIQFENAETAEPLARMRVVEISAGYNHGCERFAVSDSIWSALSNRRTMGRKPIPKKIWKRNIIAVAPSAAGRNPVDNRAAVRMKQSDRPVAEIIKRARRP